MRHSQSRPVACAGHQLVVAVADRADIAPICDGAIGRDAVIQRDPFREPNGGGDRGVDPPVAGNAGEGVVVEPPSRGAWWGGTRAGVQGEEGGGEVSGEHGV